MGSNSLNGAKTVINNDMDSNKVDETQESSSQESKPNESTGIYVRGFLRITDPESGEVVVETAN